MIEIKLQGIDVEIYLNQRGLQKDYDTLKRKYDELVADQKHLLTVIPPQVSTKVIEDTQKAKDIKPNFTKPAITTGGAKWSDREIGVIKYAMGRPKAELNRKFKVIVDKLGRTESAVRTKLGSMGIIIKKGVLHYKD